MELPLRLQAAQFAAALLFGLLCGVVYDLLRAPRRRIPALTVPADLLYALFLLLGLLALAALGMTGLAVLKPASYPLLLSMAGGIVMPSIDELSLEQPEIVRQGGRYGVRLEASAPSIHMMKAVIHTELSPIVGTEKQSEDLVQSLLKDFEDDPVRLWESNIFGKSLHELVNDGLQNKLLHMPQEARGRLQETLERVINEGCTGLICILI